MHREVLEDALLDLVEPVVVLVEDLASSDEVELLLALPLPRQPGEPVEVRPDDRRLRRRLRHLLETAEFLERLLLDLLGHARLLDLLLVLVDLGLDLVVLPELLLDRLELLAEEVLALRLGHLLLDAVLDLAAELEDLQFLTQEARCLLDAGLRVECLEDRLLLLDLQVQVERDEVREPAGLLDAHGRHEHLLRDGLPQLRGLLEVRDEIAHERFRLDVDLRDLGDELDTHFEVRVVLDELQHAHALLAFHERLRGAVRQLQLLQHGRDAPDLVQVLARGILRLCLALSDEGDHMILAHRLFERGDRTLPADEQRHDEVREQDQVPQRDQRQHVRDTGSLVLGHGRGPFGDCGILT